MNVFFFTKPASVSLFHSESNLTSIWNSFSIVVIPMEFVLNYVRPYLVNFFEICWQVFTNSWPLLLSSVFLRKPFLIHCSLGYRDHYMGMGIICCAPLFWIFQKQDVAMYLQRSHQAACHHLHQHICLLKLLIIYHRTYSYMSASSNQVH